MEKPQLLLEKLQEIHLNCGIIGVANKDQKEIAGGFVNFNYISEREMMYASVIFSKRGIENFPREGKECNLTFILEEEKIVIKKRHCHRSISGSKAIESVLWILRKIYKKKILTIPTQNGVKGLSTRGIVACSKHDLLEIQKQLISYFGIYITVEDSNDNRRTSEFFIVTTPNTKKLCEGKEVLTVKEIIKHKEDNNMFKINEAMNQEIRNFLLDSGYKNHSREIPENEKSIIHFQFRNIQPGRIKIFLFLGDKEKKEEAAGRVEQILVNHDFVVEKHKTWVLVSKAETGSTPQHTATEKSSTFFGSLSKEQKNQLLAELGVNIVNSSSVVDIIAEKFFFIEKGNSITHLLNKEAFSNPKDVKKSIGE